MEDLVLPPSQKQTSRKSLPQHKDLWRVVREGSVSDVDLALSLLKKSGGNINARNLFGLTPLHIATWRNHVPIVRRLLEAGADPNARDGESGWSSLHRALHFGHLAVACVLVRSGASFTLEDSKSRLPVDLLSGPVTQAIGEEISSIATEVFSWGSGVNYQLGTGNAHIQKLPCKVDSLHESFIKLISAAKFHSVAVTARGEVYTWGFGRGGRLGHPDFDIHSGQAAVITPRQVTSGLGARRVQAISAAKHHTVVATEGGEVFTWGSNREGQLGYTSVDSQPTPRRVSSLKTRITAVSAANKHTAVVSEAGEVFTWGCNKEGQLGYGTSNSASNYTPRVVECLKGRSFAGVSTAKYHTIVLGSDGEVFTWGHRLVTPRRVVITRNIKKVGNTVLKFHRKERLKIVAIAAGMTHSTALTDDGALFYWISSDPDLRCHQLYSLCERSIVSISAGKYWTGAVTLKGDVYMWDGKKGKDELITPTRLYGVKKAVTVSVGETHLLFVSSLYHPSYPHSAGDSSKAKPHDDLAELHEGFMFDTMELDDAFSNREQVSSANCNVSAESGLPSLKSLCERSAAEHLVEPQNVLPLLEIADSLGADCLKNHCAEIAIRDLDYILTVSGQAFAGTSLDVLVDLEKLLDLKSSEPWHSHRLPTPTASFPPILNSEEETEMNDSFRMRDYSIKNPNTEGDKKLDGFLQPYDAVAEGLSRQVRALRKKLQQIELLEEKLSKGQLLDDQQTAKLKMRPVLETSLAQLGEPVQTKSCSSVDERGNSKRGVSKKQRKKSKQNSILKEEGSGDYVESGTTIKGSMDSQVPLEMNKEKDSYLASDLACEETSDSGFSGKKEIADSPSDSGLSGKKAIADSPREKITGKKKNRKGGLSMFLSGALDDIPKKPVPAPVVVVKSEGPAWGGAKLIPNGTTSSLRLIQDEQSKTIQNRPTKKKEMLEDSSVARKLSLGSFLPSSPIPMLPTRKGQVSDEEKNTPWAAASSTSPSPLSRASIRDIQLQQGKHHQQGMSYSPKTKTSGFSPTTSQGSPSESGGTNRWFKPETDSPSSLRSIQIEEKAIKELRRFYSNVRIVKNQP